MRDELTSTFSSVDTSLDRDLLENASKIASHLFVCSDKLGLVAPSHDYMVLDARNGTQEAGEWIVRALLGPRAAVSIEDVTVLDTKQQSVRVTIENPVVPCMASQYAGLQLKGDDGEFLGMGSGPVRAVTASEEIVRLLMYSETLKVKESGFIFLETSKDEITSADVELIAEKVGLDPFRLTVVYANTNSLVGRMNVAARSVETALHALHCYIESLELPDNNSKHELLRGITLGEGRCPLVPACGDDMKAMGITNDAIRNGTTVEFQFLAERYYRQFVDLAPKLPVNAPAISHNLGKTALDILNEANWDFTQVESSFTVREIVAHLDDDSYAVFGPALPDQLDQVDSVLAACLNIDSWTPRRGG